MGYSGARGRAGGDEHLAFAGVSGARRLPVLSPGAGAPFQFAAITFRAALGGRDAITAPCASVPGAIAVTAGAAAATSRTTIVAAVRGLDEPSTAPGTGRCHRGTLCRSRSSAGNGSR
jgi:hypothetical protein